MGFKNWLYTNSTKNLRVKIVHPGGHAELHDRPILAAEIIRRNPRCCVAHPNVFKQPWAIVQPDAVLMPGQKVYIVPISTVRKLQKLSLKRSSSLSHEAQNGQSSQQEIQEGKENDNDDDDDEKDSSCCSIEDTDGNCMKSFKGENGKGKESCFTCMFKGKTKQESSKEKVSSSSGQMGKNGEAPKKLITALDYWQPSLHSIVEEKSIQEASSPARLTIE